MTTDHRVSGGFMRMTRSGVGMVPRALAASLLLASAASAQDAPTVQRTPYPATLQFGTGLINIPVAWVSPRNADMWLNTSGKTIEHFTNVDAMNWATKWNTNIAIDTHWLGRFSVGAAAYSQNPEWGFFGQVMLLREEQFGGFVPSIAVGVRNIGPYEHSDRLLIAHDIQLDADSLTYEEAVSGVFNDLKSTPTLYAVATKEFGTPLATSGSFSIGWGNGIFSDDGGLGDQYNMKGTLAEGLFLGGRVSFHPTLNTALTVLAENDGWDWNAGVLADWRGITLGLYGTELEEGSRDPAKCELCRVYNYRKWNVSLGYAGNLIDISRGVILRTRVTELTREQYRLRAEIANRERRIRALEVALRRAQAGELADIARRREELERQIQEEREAIRRAEERLQNIERTPAPAPPPASSSSPPPAAQGAPAQGAPAPSSGGTTPPAFR
ncbi:MAG: hypothetical protein ACT4PJ_04830 [Gemmatimonadaceae bacterium]